MKKERETYLYSKISKLIDILSDFAEVEEISFDDMNVIFSAVMAGMDMEFCMGRGDKI